MNCNVYLLTTNLHKETKNDLRDFKSKVSKTENHRTAKCLMINPITFTAVYSPALILTMADYCK
jgi:hypothetical protein